MEENIKNESKLENGKGIKVLLVILIILVLAVLSLLVYKLFVADKNDDKKVQNITVESSKEKSTTENTTIVPVEDTFAQYVFANGDGQSWGNYLVSHTFILKNGKVYEATKKEKMDDASIANMNTSFPLKTLSEQIVFSTSAANSKLINLSEIKDLPSIKRIKGMVYLGTSHENLGLLLVSEDGRTYIYTFNSDDSQYDEHEIIKAPYLEKYKVEDIVGYYLNTACKIGEHTVMNYAQCGGEYNIIDQDGNTQHYQVNTDGSLTQK